MVDYFHFLWAEMEIIQFIQFYLLLKALGRSLLHVLDKITWWHFQRTSKEVIWPQNFLNYMQGSNLIKLDSHQSKIITKTLLFWSNVFLL